MNNLIVRAGLIFFILVSNLGCWSQQNRSEHKSTTVAIDRMPVVAGQFYPADPGKLSNQVNNFFASAVKPEFENVRAVIVPHAGYVFSGNVAASAYNQVDYSTVENVFILASSHRAYYEGASIYQPGNYTTPLGKIESNQEIIEELISTSKNFSYIARAHQGEHSLEVQLPFLQAKMGDRLRIVPIVLGTQSAYTCRQIASDLQPYFKPGNLFVISSDFSHYPPYQDAVEVDDQTLQPILNNDPAKFLKTVEAKPTPAVPNLSTKTCGWTSILTLLYLTEGAKDLHYRHVIYENSGDSQYGDKQRVVGYHGIVLTSQDSQDGNSGFNLTSKDKEVLLEIARQTIEHYLDKQEIITVDDARLTPTIKKHCGAFVTLNKHHELRGCIGRFTADEPLYSVVQSMAVAAATQDSRFYPVKKSELKTIEIEISVLTPLKKIESVDAIELGKHGIYIKKGYRSGTFLPQVATETGWTLEEFLGHCSRDKARIGWDGWKDAEVYTYEAIVFSEE